MRDTVERELIGSSKVLLEHGLDVARREAAQERADHKRLQRPGARHVLAQHPALEAELGRSSSTVPLVVRTLRSS
jgi:hypothetical protein